MKKQKPDFTPLWASVALATMLLMSLLTSCKKQPYECSIIVFDGTTAVDTLFMYESSHKMCKSHIDTAGNIVDSVICFER